MRVGMKVPERLKICMADECMVEGTRTTGSETGEAAWGKPSIHPSWLSVSLRCRRRWLMRPATMSARPQTPLSSDPSPAWSPRQSPGRTSGPDRSPGPCQSSQLFFHVPRRPESGSWLEVRIRVQVEVRMRLRIEVRITVRVRARNYISTSPDAQSPVPNPGRRPGPSPSPGGSPDATPDPGLAGRSPPLCLLVPRRPAVVALTSARSCPAAAAAARCIYWWDVKRKISLNRRQHDDEDLTHSPARVIALVTWTELSSKRMQINGNAHIARQLEFVNYAT